MCLLSVPNAIYPRIPVLFLSAQTIHGAERPSRVQASSISFYMDCFFTVLSFQRNGLVESVFPIFVPPPQITQVQYYRTVLLVTSRPVNTLNFSNTGPFFVIRVLSSALMVTTQETRGPFRTFQYDCLSTSWEKIK